ncbi:hypothetical protein NIES2104_07410 [Leptolyngbya sp. NIES-2104]|nr:hypothetical protein NIES2104_07410 [Leptolyngbya sp. NIES-2104]
MNCPGNPATAKSRTDFIQLMTKLNLPTPKQMLEVLPANELCGQKF